MPPRPRRGLPGPRSDEAHPRGRLFVEGVQRVQQVELQAARLAEPCERARERPSLVAPGLMPRRDDLDPPDEPIDLPMPDRRALVGGVAIKRSAAEGPRGVHRAAPLRREQRARPLVARQRERPMRARSAGRRSRGALVRPSASERGHRPPNRQELDRRDVRLAPRDAEPTTLRRRRAAPPFKRRVRVPKHRRELAQKLVREAPRSPAELVPPRLSCCPPRQCLAPAPRASAACHARPI